MSNMSQPQSLEKLMYQAQQGDKSAYSRLFAEITPLLRSFVRNKLNNAQDCEDVLQEILISVHKASHTYDSTRSFKKWMFTIARYRIADHLRALYSEIDKGQKVNWDDYLHEFPTENNVTNDYENREYLSRLMKAVSIKQRKILTMMKIEGYTAQETAEKLNMSESAVKVSAHRAYKVLATKAEEENE